MALSSLPHGFKSLNVARAKVIKPTLSSTSSQHLLFRSRNASISGRRMPEVSSST